MSRGCCAPSTHCPTGTCCPFSCSHSGTQFPQNPCDPPETSCSSRQVLSSWTCAGPCQTCCPSANVLSSQAPALPRDTCCSQVCRVLPDTGCPQDVTCASGHVLVPMNACCHPGSRLSLWTHAVLVGPGCHPRTRAVLRDSGCFHGHTCPCGCMLSPWIHSVLMDTRCPFGYTLSLSVHALTMAYANPYP